MEELPRGNYLKFKPNQLQDVRKLYDLEKPGRIDEAVDLLSDWVKKQEHFKKKEYSRVYLEILLIISKGSIERSKARLDKLCTLRTIWPEYFVSSDVHCCVKQSKAFKSLILPEITDDFTRINIAKLNENEPLTPEVVMYYIKYSNIVGEYLKVHDYPLGFRVVIDLININIMNFLTAVTPTQLSQLISIYLDGYGMRIKSIHILSQSKMVDALVSVLKQILSKKVGSRLYVHKSIEPVYDFIPRSILPEDYGGDAPAYDVLFEQFVKELGSPEHIEYMKECNAASTEESKRLKTTACHDNFIGMSGSFRTLCVD